MYYTGCFGYLIVRQYTTIAARLRSVVSVWHATCLVRKQKLRTSNVGLRLAERTYGK